MNASEGPRCPHGQFYSGAGACPMCSEARVVTREDCIYCGGYTDKHYDSCPLAVSRLGMMRRSPTRCGRVGCGHELVDHEPGIGPCDVRYDDGTHCICYEWEREA